MIWKIPSKKKKKLNFRWKNIKKSRGGFEKIYGRYCRSGRSSEESNDPEPKKRERNGCSNGKNIDDNEANCAKHQKMMRERAMRIEDLEEELEAEKKYRSQTEQHRRNLQQELDDLKLKLDEAGDHSVIQAEFNRKRESDIQSMRKDLEEAKIKQEVALAVARKKYDQALCGLRDECDNHLQSRTKLEKDKIDLENSLRGAVAQVERGRIDKANLERELKRDRSTLIEFKTKLDEANRYAFDFEQIKNRQEKDKNDLLRRLEDAENQIGQMNTQRLSLMNQLEDAKRLAAYDIKERSNIMSKYKQMEREHDNMRSHLDDEVQAKQELQRQIAQLNEQIQSWRSKYDNHTVPMIEDMENAKMKLQLRLAEAQDTIEGLNSHCINLEKSKQRVTMELEDLQAQYEVSSTKCRQLEKASNNFDKAVEEWKRKVEELQGCLNQSEKENRIYHAELASVKQYNSQLQNDNSKANFEIKRLGEEIKELLSQIGDGGRTFRELQNQKRQMVLERDELQATLQEAESALESEENKLSSSKLENEKLKSDMESRIRDKEDEFEDSKKYFLRLIASLEASFVAEQKTKGELQRLKKRLEADIRELEMALDHSNHTNNELHRNFKRTMVQNSEIQKLLEEEKNAKEEVREKLFVNERRTNSLQNELEKCKTFMEQNDRTQRQLEMEMKDIKGELHSESIRYNSLSQVKRKLEAEILSLRAELVDCNHCIKDSEMKYRQAIIDTMTLSEDLKNMVDRVNKEESLRRGLEVQLKENVIHLEEVEANLDTEERLRIDAIKDKRKSERKVKDYEVQLEEKERSCHRFNDMILPLHGKIRLLKQQIEEAEEIAALNLAKFKKAIGEAEDSEKRAFIAEQAITKLRAKSAVPGGLYY
ncbi:MYH6_7 [Lepeophtheirus salmonis]|uniref:Paramyosin n=1 Tax=Lepeophtheirus salmonis TaxID=72036 RepID=A0A7R8CY44_LEPSM|nr:MYH6_7 [Lepeophtheirus salmonis]CAF2966789.1 MYH6_7 [Lepeophtheirus salmonis]